MRSRRPGWSRPRRIRTCRAPSSSCAATWPWSSGCSARRPESANSVAAIHGPRLERLLEKLVDTPVRGFGYEAEGSVDPAELAAGAEIVERAGETWRIPVTLLTEERTEPGWAGRSAEIVAGLLGV